MVLRDLLGEACLPLDGFTDPSATPSAVSLGVDGLWHHQGCPLAANAWHLAHLDALLDLPVHASCLVLLPSMAGVARILQVFERHLGPPLSATGHDLVEHYLDVEADWWALDEIFPFPHRSREALRSILSERLPGALVGLRSELARDHLMRQMWADHGDGPFRRTKTVLVLTEYRPTDWSEGLDVFTTAITLRTESKWLLAATDELFVPLLDHWWMPGIHQWSRVEDPSVLEVAAGIWDPETYLLPSDALDAARRL